MTTIILGDGSTNLEIFSAKIEEQNDKNLISWSEYVPTAQWTTKSAQKNTIDSKNITTSFVITGRIDRFSSSSSGASSSLVARDRLKSYLTKGGSINFQYGIIGEVAGLSTTYTPVAKSYYSSTGFEVQITRLSISENAKGGDDGGQLTGFGVAAEKGVPTSFDVQLTLLVCKEYSS